MLHDPVQCILLTGCCNNSAHYDKKQLAAQCDMLTVTRDIFKGLRKHELCLVSNLLVSADVKSNDGSETLAKGEKPTCIVPHQKVVSVDMPKGNQITFAEGPPQAHSVLHSQLANAEM